MTFFFFLVSSSNRFLVFGPFFFLNPFYDMLKSKRKKYGGFGIDKQQPATFSNGSGV